MNLDEEVKLAACRLRPPPVGYFVDHFNPQLAGLIDAWRVDPSTIWSAWHEQGEREIADWPEYGPAHLFSRLPEDIPLSKEAAILRAAFLIQRMGGKP